MGGPSAYDKEELRGRSPTAVRLHDAADAKGGHSSALRVYERIFPCQEEHHVLQGSSISCHGSGLFSPLSRKEGGEYPIVVLFSMSSFLTVATQGAYRDI